MYQQKLNNTNIQTGHMESIPPSPFFFENVAVYDDELINVMEHPVKKIDSFTRSDNSIVSELKSVQTFQRNQLEMIRLLADSISQVSTAQNELKDCMIQILNLLNDQKTTTETAKDETPRKLSVTELERKASIKKTKK